MLIRAIIILTTITFMASCSTTGQKPKPPEVSFSGASLIEMGLFEQIYGLELTLQNPNDYSLPVTGMVYKVFINDIQFASGVSDKGFDLKRLSTQKVNVSVRGNLLKIAPKLGVQIKDINKANQQKFKYKITGDLNTSLSEESIPFVDEGEVSISELMSR